MRPGLAGVAASAGLLVGGRRARSGDVEIGECELVGGERLTAVVQTAMTDWDPAVAQGQHAVARAVSAKQVGSVPPPARSERVRWR